MTTNDESSTAMVASGAEGEQPVPVSSTSSLDSFIMELPTSDTIDPAIGSLNDMSLASGSGLEARAMGPPPALLAPNPQFSVPGGASSSEAFIVQHGGAGAQSASVPEFLYQLTKMLTDDNRSIIEWSNGKQAKQFRISLPPSAILLDDFDSPRSLDDDHERFLYA